MWICLNCFSFRSAANLLQDKLYHSRLNLGPGTVPIFVVGHAIGWTRKHFLPMMWLTTSWMPQIILKLAQQMSIGIFQHLIMFRCIKLMNLLLLVTIEVYYWELLQICRTFWFTSKTLRWYSLIHTPIMTCSGLHLCHLSFLSCPSVYTTNHIW